MKAIIPGATGAHGNLAGFGWTNKGTFYNGRRLGNNNRVRRHPKSFWRQVFSIATSTYKNDLSDAQRTEWENWAAVNPVAGGLFGPSYTNGIQWFTRMWIIMAENSSVSPLTLGTDGRTEGVGVNPLFFTRDPGFHFLQLHWTLDEDTLDGDRLMLVTIAPPFVGTGGWWKVNNWASEIIPDAGIPAGTEIYQETDMLVNLPVDAHITILMGACYFRNGSLGLPVIAYYDTL